jgi:uncharacterized protein with HEPN domain
MQLRDRQIIDKLISESEELIILKVDFTLERFLDDERTKRAVCMTLINIGELVKGLSNEVKQEYSAIPWKLIAGLRDVAAHHYQTLSMEDIWLTANDDIPDFLENLRLIPLGATENNEQSEKSQR